MASSWDRATAALLLAAGFLVLATFRDFGATWDEAFQSELGRDVAAWFASGGRDESALSGGSTGNLNLYGPAFEVAAERAGRALPFDPVETRHLLNALVALAGVAGAGLLARRLGGSRAGLFAVALLLSTPTWWGHGFANSKDIPFAAAYPWIVLTALRASRPGASSRLRSLLACGAALGAGLAVRPGGLVLLLPLVAGILLAGAVAGSWRDGGAPVARAVAVATGRLGVVTAIGWIGMLASWPHGLRHPISGPLEAVELARHFTGTGVVRFAGAWHSITDLPRSYAPLSFLAVLPESWLAIAGVGLISACMAWRGFRARPPERLEVERREEAPWLDVAMVAGAGAGPVLAAVILRPVLYDGIRHLLFVLPVLAAAAGWTLSASVAALPGWGRVGALALTGTLAVAAVVDAVRLHPYEYVYFNRAVAGGIQRAARDFELDYWGATGREAMGWIAKNVVPRDGTPLVVSTTADPFLASHWVEGDPALRSRYVFATERTPDLRIALPRYFQNRLTGRVLHRIERMGVPLVYVLGDSSGDSALTLEAGSLALSLATGPGWVGTPRIERGVELARWDLQRVRGLPALGDAEIRTAREGALPTLEALRAEVVGRLSNLGPGAVEVRPVQGPAARGWVAWARRAAGEPFPGDAVAGAVVGDRAVVIVSKFAADAEASSRELAEWLQGARMAGATERRPP